jgi:predicted DNA-binding antitoxin AbrB/MazE fold protein
MSERIEAIYDDGVLVPLVPLSLPDKARVQLLIEPHNTPASHPQAKDEWEKSLFGLGKQCGVSLPNAALSSDALYE